jgi:hypothetical protein
MVSSLSFSQATTLCSLQTDIFKIELSENVPLVTSNDNETITLTFTDQSVTDFFADFNIYNFFQMYPSSSATLAKYYKIEFDSKSLIESMNTNVSVSIIKWVGPYAVGDNLPIRTTINSDIIQALDGKSFEVTKYRSVSDDQCDPFNSPISCYLVDVPSEFNFIISFDYDTETGLLHLENEELTSCGNAFSIDLAGGISNEDNTTSNVLQLWNSNSEISTPSQSSDSCHSPETIIFEVLDIACAPFDNDQGNFYVSIDSENETIQFVRELAIFGYSIIEFSETNLSIVDNNFQNIKPFQKDNNPYLQLANLNNQSVDIEIYNTSGQQVIKAIPFEVNNLNISKFSSGLYFIRLSNLNNQQKIFKFLKN